MQAMKMDPANSIVQSEAAVVTTKAAELFLQRLALNSQAMCEAKKRNTIRYVYRMNVLL
jgi:histone H3/H4